jgi:hypothetical protein
MLGDVDERSVVGEGVGPQANNGFGHNDVELDRDHPGGQVDDETELAAGVELISQLTRAPSPATPGRPVRPTSTLTKASPC